MLLHIQCKNDACCTVSYNSSQQVINVWPFFLFSVYCFPISIPESDCFYLLCSTFRLFFILTHVHSLSLCRIGGLRDKLNRSNLTDVSFMIVNEREAQSRAMYWELKRRAPPGVPVYQQAPLQNDVWEALDGDKDDFLVYDR